MLLWLLLLLMFQLDLLLQLLLLLLTLLLLLLPRLLLQSLGCWEVHREEWQWTDRIALAGSRCFCPTVCHLACSSRLMSVIPAAAVV